MFIEESRSLIPNLAIAEHAKPIRSSIIAEVTFEKYIGACNMNDAREFQNCSSTTSFSLQNFQVLGETSIQCAKRDSQSCTVRIVCNKCAMTDAVRSQISILLLDPVSYCSAFNIVLNASAAYPNQNSSIAYRIESDSTKFFRGSFNATEFAVSAVQTTFQSVEDKNDTGYHLVCSTVTFYTLVQDFRHVALGEQVNYLEFNTKNGIHLQLSFYREANSLEIIRTQKKSVVSIISEILGTCSGVIGGIGALMKLVEGFFEDYLLALYNKLRKKKDAKDSELQDKPQA